MSRSVPRQVIGQSVIWALILVCLGATRVACGQWSLIDLHPQGASESHGLGVCDGQQVGYAIVNGRKVASLWSGTAESWVSLEPAGATESIAFRTRGGVQVGYAKIGGQRVAGKWSGTAASWTPLAPAGATDSIAYGLDAEHQVGFAVVNGVRQASLWSGTAQSWISLHPANTPYSIAFGVDGNMQVGTWQNHCAMWNGTAASVFQLPVWAGGQVYAIHQGQLAGVCYTGRYAEETAYLWSGSPIAATELDRWGPYGYSMAFDTYGGYQIGYDSDYSEMAGLWHGTDGTFEALYSIAITWDTSFERPMGVWTSATGLFVAADTPQAGQRHAALCRRPLCRPDLDYSGTLTANDIFIFLNAWFAGESTGNFDNDYVVEVQDIFKFLNAWFVGC